MRKLLYTFALIGVLINFTTAQGIKFEKGTWAEIKAKAQAENKFIFVDAYTAWCGPCKMQDKKVFPLKEVGDFFNKNYVSYKIDIEKGEGRGFAKKYKIRVVPTMLYFNSKGEIVHKTVGVSPEKPAEALLAKAKNALNPETQAYTLQHRFEKGEKGRDFLKKYVDALSVTGEDISKPVSMYLTQLSQSEWATAKGWSFIKKYVNKSTVDAFMFVAKNQDKFVKLAENKKEVEKFITRVFNQDMVDLMLSKDQAKFETLKGKLKQAYGKNAAKHIARAEYMLHARDKENLHPFACKYFDKYCDTASDFYAVAWRYHKIYDDVTRLEKALTWIDHAIKLDKNFYYPGMKAELLFKLKRYQKAKKEAEAFIALAKKAKKNSKQAEKLLEKINAKL